MRFFTRIPFLILMLLSVLFTLSAYPGVQQGTAVAEQVRPSGYLPSNVFSSLDEAIAYYRHLTAVEPWHRLQGSFMLREGDQHAQVKLVRHRLWLLGDLPDTESMSPSEFDLTLKGAVMRFQHRHGLKADGVVGPDTRAILNVSPRVRWYQLLVNRQREVDDVQIGDGDVIEINIPDFRLFYYRDRELLTSMKVIVGRKERPTPVLQSAVSAIEFNPDWNVPKRIAFEDMLPLLQEGEESLARTGVKLVEGWPEGAQPPREISVEQLDMARFYHGELATQQRFWQPPGSANPLGQLKFVFSNRFSIYMHDTPAVALFNSSRRAFSSGCIRLERPHELAELLFNKSGADPGEQIQELLLSRRAESMDLPGTVPIFTRYRTAWLEPDSGVLHFRHDIYGRDRNELSLSDLPASDQPHP